MPWTSPASDSPSRRTILARTLDLWHAAGRAAREGRKRLLTLQGVLWTGPVLVLGSFLWRLFAGDPAPGVHLAGLARPFSYAFEPLTWAHANDRDVALLAWILVQGTLLVLLWGLFGGAVTRLAAVDLATGRREESPAAFAFARRHWRSVTAARLAFWIGCLAPLGLAVAIASLGRLPGWFGTILLAAGALAAVGLVLGAVVLASVNLVAGFLVGPTIAVEDSDAFDAVSRTFTYVVAGLPRLVLVRLAFLGGVLLGSGWRGLRTVAVALLSYACLKAGAGDAALDRALAALSAGGTPPDAARLGAGDMDQVLAAALALAVGGLVALWVADLISRVLCARVAAYLVLRQAIDGVPTTTLRTAPRAGGHRGPEEAGFVEVSRIDTLPPAGGA